VAAASAADSSTGAPRWSLALGSIIAFWLVYFLIATVRAAIADMPAQGEMIVRRAFVTVAAIGLTWLLYMLLRRFERLSTRALLALSFAASIPLALAYASVNWVAFHIFPIEAHLALEAAWDGKMPQSPLAIIVSTALEWYFFICCWAIMGVALIASARQRAAERQAATFRQAAQEAELRALRYQVNPHFLFNTLNSLSSLVMHDRAAEAEAMILNLSTFFRASLARDATENIPLADEIRLQRLYLDIEKIRFPDRLLVRLLVPDSLGDALVPALILQPLIENAIKYGVSPSRRPVTVTIAADSTGDRLDLWVRDDGETRPGSAPRPPGDCSTGCGVGLANVAARLKAAWGEAAECIAGSPKAGGWIVRLSMPLVRG
jgi:signal transduction histidine kinase